MGIATDPSATLRRALLLDAAASGTMGVMLALAAGALHPLLGLPESLLRWVGIFLIPFALFLLTIALRAPAPRALVMTIVVGNVLWVVASLALLLSGEVAPTTLGTSFIIAQAIAVAVFAYFEHGALRRDPATLALGTSR